MAKNLKAVSDEEIIAALLQHGTVKAAAEAAGTTPRTIYDRMQDRTFRAAYSAAKDDIIRKAVFSINEKLSEAIDEVAAIMTDKEISPAIRLQAAQTILNNAERFAARLRSDETYSRHEGQDPFDFSFN